MSEGNGNGADQGDRERERLRARVKRDPGCADFPALAEAERRAGRPEEAQRVAEAGLRAAPERLAGRVALGLALLDQGEVAAARRELAGVLDTGGGTAAREEGPPPAGEPLASPQAPEGRRGRAGRGGSAQAPPGELPVGTGSAFRTRTMARLLESQGDRGRAEEILDGLEGAGEGAKGPEAEQVPASSAPAAVGNAPSRETVERTLERWLENVQRGRS